MLASGGQPVSLSSQSPADPRVVMRIVVISHSRDCVSAGPGRRLELPSAVLDDQTRPNRHFDLRW